MIRCKRSSNHVPAYPTGNNGNGKRHVKRLDCKNTGSEYSDERHFILAHFASRPAKRERNKDESDSPVYRSLRDREKTIGDMHGITRSCYYFSKLL